MSNMQRDSLSYSFCSTKKVWFTTPESGEPIYFWLDFIGEIQHRETNVVCLYHLVHSILVFLLLKHFQTGSYVHCFRYQNCHTRNYVHCFCYQNIFECPLHYQEFIFHFLALGQRAEARVQMDH